MPIVSQSVLEELVEKSDVSATRKIYSSIKRGGAAECGCDFCNNFVSQIPDAFPQEVLVLFENLGIDPLKDAEVYELGPGIIDQNKKLYAGEYYFVSENPPDIQRVQLSDDFEICVQEPSPLMQDEFLQNKNSKCLYFQCEIPWLLGGGT